MTDVVPDDRIGELTDFLLNSASQPEGDRGTVDRLNAAWDAIEKLVPRLHREARGNVARAAIEHFMYHEPNLCRPHIVKAVHHAIICGIPKEMLMGVAEATLPLATTTKSNFDYTDIINLLCNLARTDDAVKDRIRLVLYREAEPLKDAILAQVAPIFGRHLEDPDAVAEKASKHVRLQVQRLGVSQEPQRLGYMTMEYSRGDTKIATSLGAGQELLAVVLTHKDKVSNSAFSALVDAMIEMITNSDNVLANRISLVITGSVKH